MNNEITTKVFKVLDSLRDKNVDYDLALRITGGSSYNQLLSKIIEEDNSEEKTQVINMLERIYSNLSEIKNNPNQTLNYWLKFDKARFKYQDLPNSFWSELESSSKSVSEINYFSDTEDNFANGSYKNKQILSSLIEAVDENYINVFTPKEQSIFKRDLYITTRNIIPIMQDLEKSRSAKCQEAIKGIEVLKNEGLLMKPFVYVFSDVTMDISQGDIILKFTAFGKGYKILIENKNLIHKSDEINVFKVDGLFSNFMTKKAIPTYVAVKG